MAFHNKFQAVCPNLTIPRAIATLDNNPVKNQRGCVSGVAIDLIFYYDKGTNSAGAGHENISERIMVAITAGRLDFGPWEQIFYGEFDGGRKKRV